MLSNVHTLNVEEQVINNKGQNIAICVSGTAVLDDFSILMVKSKPCYDLIAKGQCFPLYTFCNGEKESETTMTEYAGSLFANDIDTPRRKENITDAALAAFRAQYKDDAIEKEDIFFYTYGCIRRGIGSVSPITSAANCHASPSPRISGRSAKLAKSWPNCTSNTNVEPWPLDELGTENEPKNEAERKRFYRVEKMSYGGKSRDKDKTVIHYNNRITLTGIPPEAHEYVVNGKPALDWLVERYAVTTGKQSGLLNDPNEWSDDPRYILDLVKRVTRVAVETVHIVRALPALG